MTEHQLKPLSEAVRRNWELWCEAAFAKNARFDRSERRDLSMLCVVGVGFCASLIAGFVTLQLYLSIVLVMLTCVVGLVVLALLSKEFERLGVLPESVQNLRLGDVRAASLHELYLYMVELQKKMLEHPRWDVAYKIRGDQEFRLEEHFARFASQMEVLEDSFRTHGELGALLDPGQIEAIGTRAIAQTQETERDIDNRRRTAAEVERSLRETTH